MTIAELFVNLGVKGDGAAQKALGGIKGTLGEVSTGALAAKAGILAVMYGMQQMMSSSANAGNNLKQFSTFTGLSAETLQRWQYAAQQVGVANDEITGSIKNVQGAMTNMLLGKGKPEGMAMVANKVGFDMSKARDTFYVMEQLQKFAKVVPPDVGNNMLKSFGLSEGTINAMRRQAFDAKTLRQAPIYKDNETNQLQKVDVAWENLGQKIKMAMGHLTASKGLNIVGEISKLTDKVLKLVEAFMVLAEKIKLFQQLGKVFEGWNSILKGLTDVASGKVTAKDIATGAFEGLKGAGMSAYESLTGSGETPAAPPVGGKTAPTTQIQNNNIKQDLHFQHDGKDHQKTGHSVKKAVQDSYRQMSAQTQGT